MWRWWGGLGRYGRTGREQRGGGGKLALGCCIVGGIDGQMQLLRDGLKE